MKTIVPQHQASVKSAFEKLNHKLSRHKKLKRKLKGEDEGQILNLPQSPTHFREAIAESINARKLQNQQILNSLEYQINKEGYPERFSASTTPKSQERIFSKRGRKFVPQPTLSGNYKNVLWFGRYVEKQEQIKVAKENALRILNSSCLSEKQPNDYPIDIQDQDALQNIEVGSPRLLALKHKILTYKR